MLNFMDLSRQYESIKDEMRAAFEEVCDSTAFSGGVFADRFGEEFAQYLGVPYVATVSSGTDALHLAVRALGIGAGDEVIVPANTFIASAWGAIHAGATPVFVDCTSDTWEIDASQIESCITKNTKAIIGVHLYGQPFDVDAVLDISRRYKLSLIEDVAQAHGALYKGKLVGTFGDAGCFSFYPGKNLGAYGEAGGVSVSDKELFDRINMLKAHGSEHRYYHDIVGFNMRMDGLQGAILSKKLPHLDTWNDKRVRIAQTYRSHITNELITLQVVPDYAAPVWHLFEVCVDNRDRFVSFMAERDITVGCHYPVPCHLQKATAYLGYKIGDFPNAEWEAAHCVSLPIFPEMTDDEIWHVIESCNDYR